MWKYRIGDEVRHTEYDDLRGVVLGQRYSEEVDEDMETGQPWYELMWKSGDSEGISGQEPESVLTAVDPN